MGQKHGPLKAQQHTHGLIAAAACVKCTERNQQRREMIKRPSEHSKSLRAMSAGHKKCPDFQSVVSYVFQGALVLWERFLCALKVSLQHPLPLPQQVCNP